MTILPLWIVPGFLDYLCHRRTQIERTSGTPESLAHIAMTASAGAPILLGLYCEINALVLAASLAGVVVHTAIAWIDVSYTVPRRFIPAFEQNVHAGLEGLPVATFAALATAYPAPLRELLASGARAPSLRLEPKREAVPAWYRRAFIASSIAFVVLPHLEELWRCVRAQRED